MPTQIFVNMLVKDLARSMTFYKAIGWKFNKAFTNDDAACLVISDTIYAMLHTPKSIRRFLPKSRKVIDPAKQTEVLLAVSVEKRRSVDTMHAKALKAGGGEVRPAEDHGWMYGQTFSDPDGHIWELLWIDPKHDQG
ncbi:MAG: VOC family protein [Flavobacteriales bacterium]|nr:VOC family protein [Flavobacteriales bacterium]